MGFDPVTMALCKGKNAAGDTTVPYIHLTTTLQLGQEVSLEKGECDALSNAWEYKRPVFILTTIEGIGVFAMCYSFAQGVMFLGSLITNGGAVCIDLAGYENVQDEVGKTYRQWKATVTGYQLTPLE